MVRIPPIHGKTWFNCDPLSDKDFDNKVILVDFFTYTCVNCVRTIPYIKTWWKKYNKEDFLILGIHTPEFEFEKEPDNVKSALKNMGISWPVVLDNDFVNWNAFTNKYWPAKYIFDKNSKLAYHHFGEGSYDKTEAVIQKLLDISDVEIEEEHSHGSVCFKHTPELYCGYYRGMPSNFGGYYPDKIADYELPDKPDDDRVALQGKFLAAAEYVETKDPHAELFVQFTATEVNLVIHPVDKNCEIQIKLDHENISPELMGDSLNEDGTLTVKKPDIYNLLKSNEPASGLLSLTPVEGDFQAYAFTFSGCC